VDPPSGGAFSTSPEGVLQVLLIAVAAQHRPQAKKHVVLISTRRVEILEETTVWQNAEPALM
jgi:hypothetical protein